jgi:hypothetical protein
MRIISRTQQTIDLSGIDDHTVRNLDIVQVGGVTRSQKGEIIIVINQAAYMPDGRTIISAGQLEWFKCTVDDKPTRVSGKTPTITTLEGYIIPITVRRGLPYIRLRPYTDDEWNKLPKVTVTSPKEWDPTVLDSGVDENWYKKQPANTEYESSNLFDETMKPKDDLMDVESDDEDRKYKSIDRVGMRAYFSSLIRGETVDDFLVYPTEDGLIEEPYESRFPSSDDKELMECFPITRQQRRNAGSKAKLQERIEGMEKDATDEAHERNDEEGEDDSVTSLSSSQKGDADGPAPLPEAGPYLVKPSKRDLSKYARYFPGYNIDTIRRTFDATTQYGTRGAKAGFTLQNQIVSPNPVLNLPRRHEDVATDTIYSSTPAVDDGSTAAQFFIGRQSMYRTIRPLGSSDKQFGRTLMDEIRRFGAMDRLISDNAKAQISVQAKDIMRALMIDDWHSEPHKGNQNFAERGWRDTKQRFNNLMNQSGAPAKAWLLALQYICFIMNHIALASLGYRTPTEWILGFTPDISILLVFIFWEPVYYKKYDAKFPNDSTECLGRFVGFSDNVGHAMTYKVLTADNKIIRRAVLRSARKPGAFKNRRAIEAAPKLAPATDLAEPVPPPKDTVILGQKEPPIVETVPEEEVAETNEEPAEDEDDHDVSSFIKSALDDAKRLRTEDDNDGTIPPPTIDATKLLGRTFIDNPDEYGEQRRAKIEAVEPTGQTTADGANELFKFRCRQGDKVHEEIMTYNKMLEWCDRDLDKDDMYRIEAILGHRKNPKTKKWELHLLWGSGEQTWNDFNLTFQDDPVTVSVYAKDNGLLSTPGWKRCKPYVKNFKRLSRMVNQRNLKNFRNRPVYKCGYQVPRNHEEAVFIDEKNGNTKWQDSEKLEMAQLFEYKCFEDLGLGAPIPEGYQKIPCHMVYDVKHCGRHKSRFVAGGHRTSTPVDSIYSGVVSLQGIRIVTFLAELNDLELWGTDIGNAYLESYTQEKVCFIAGGEFGEYAGHTFIIMKAQYGLKSSGKRWHDRLCDVLISMGFTPSKAEPDIWMRKKGDHCEYIACYVDDLMIASKNPQAIIDALEGGAHKFKLKGTGPMKFHLGCDFFRDEDGTLCFGPRKYIERMTSQYEALFGSKPKTNVTSPLEKNDHPELDTTELLDADGIQKHQSLIGILQWTISIGRFDIGTAVMTMSGFRVAPRVGHLERLKRVCGYLAKMKHGFIRVRTDEPDYSDLPHQDFDWSHTVYGNVKEQMPRDAPEPLGKRIILTSYVDANLYHDHVTGRSVTGVLHFLNQTPIEWFTKKQPTVETATHGSEFVAAKTAVQQLLGMRYTLRYLGVPIDTPTYLFGDNGSVVTSGSLPDSPLRKRHHALSYHCTRESIASGAVKFHHLTGDSNPADILSKHWGYQQVWPTLQAMLFWRGNPSELLLKNDPPSQGKGSDKCSISTEDIPDPKSQDTGKESR